MVLCLGRTSPQTEKRMPTIEMLTQRFTNAFRATGLTQQETADYLMVTRREIRAWLDPKSPKVPTRAHLRQWTEMLPSQKIALLPKTADAAGAVPSSQTEAVWWRLRCGHTQAAAAQITGVPVGEYARLEHRMVYGLPDELGWLTQPARQPDTPQTLFDPDEPIVDGPSDVAEAPGGTDPEPGPDPDTVTEMIESFHAEDPELWSILRWVAPATCAEVNEAVAAYNALTVESEAARAARGCGFTSEQMQSAFGKTPRGLTVA